MMIQLGMKRLKNIDGEQVKIPDVSQWEKVKKYVERGNLTKLTREELETITMKLYPLFCTIENLEDKASVQNVELIREVIIVCLPSGNV